MPQFNVMLKDNAPQEKIEEAKKKAVDAGGKIVNTFTLIPGFTVQYPEGHVNILKTDDNVSVEEDAEVKTQ